MGKGWQKNIKFNYYKIDDSLLEKWGYSSNFTSPLVMKLRSGDLCMVYLEWSSRDVLCGNIMCYWFI